MFPSVLGYLFGVILFVIFLLFWCLVFRFDCYFSLILSMAMLFWVFLCVFILHFHCFLFFHLNWWEIRKRSNNHAGADFVGALGVGVYCYISTPFLLIIIYIHIFRRCVCFNFNYVAPIYIFNLEAMQVNEVGGAVKDLCVFVPVPVRGQTVNHLFLQNSGSHSHHKSNYLYLFTYLGFTIWVISLIYCFKYITVYVKYYLYKFCFF